MRGFSKLNIYRTVWPVFLLVHRCNSTELIRCLSRPDVTMAN